MYERDLNELEADLAARWRPTQEQIDKAEVALASGLYEDVLSGHLLVNKQHGFWTKDVVVLPIPHLFPDRNIASEAIQKAAEAVHNATGLPVQGGWTYHRTGGRWAVFEDCLADFSDYGLERRARREAS